MIYRTAPLIVALVAVLTMTLSGAFQAPRPIVLLHSQLIQQQTTALAVFGGKKKKVKEDLSFIETRDMTREEMKQLNQQNEDIMNAELVGMTIFSLVISLPLLYLAWVGFFSETAEIAGDLSDIQ
jgi:hypothetical protein